MAKKLIISCLVLCFCK